MRKIGFSLLFLIIFLTACSRSADPAQTPQIVITRIFITTTPQPTATASPTPSATRTPTPTPSPTPTAPEIMVSGNPRAYTLFDPIPQSGAPCGWADTLDFPLAPPNGETASGGGDFGSYRERYEKFHAGEDWGLANRSNFGQPVHSIGHGQVTYAQPVGWGADKGVVIVRHTFPDGDSFLSFYGHLDPPSVILKEGVCVQRGDIVGQIGRPRTPPHLHFEIRVHFPYSTGGGYWPSDPTGAGWLPPSQTISQYRMRVSPGAVWTSEASSASSRPLGNLDAATFLMIVEDDLIAIDLLTGDELWAYKLSEHIKDALLDLNREVVYISDSVAGLLVYPLPDEDDLSADVLDPLWEQKLPSSGRMDLLPLVDGSVLVSHRDTLSAYSHQGDLLWEENQDGYLESWALADEAVIFTTSDELAPLMAANAEGLHIFKDGLAGIPLVAGGQVWLYAEDGIYKINLTTGSTQRTYALPTARMGQSTALALSDGDFLLLHSDSADRRLLSFSSDGILQREFSVPLEGDPLLFELDGDIYLALLSSYSARGTFRALEIFSVDFDQEKLMRIFEGGSRAFNPRTTWVAPVSDPGLLIFLGGTGSLYFDPEAALERMNR